MVKRVLLFGVLVFLLFLLVAPVAAQDTSHLVVLMVRKTVPAPGETVISTLNPDNGEFKDILTIPMNYTGFSISSNLDTLAYYAAPSEDGGSEASGAGSYYFYDFNTGSTRLIAANTFIPDRALTFAPLWSPDGSKVAVVTRTPHTSDVQIQILDANSGQPTLVQNINPEPYETIAWSPDGAYLAYFAEYCGRCGIGTVYVISATHADTPHAYLPESKTQELNDQLIGWLPNSRNLLVGTFENYSSAASRWSSVDVETGEIEPIPITPPTVCTWVLQTTPDTALLINTAYSRYHASGMTLPAGGTKFPFPVGYQSGSGLTCSLSYSPDATRVAVYDQADALVNITDPMTNKQVAFVRDPVTQAPALWTPDSKQLIFYDSAADYNPRQMFIANADGTGTIRAVTFDTQVNAYENILGWARVPD